MENNDYRDRKRESPQEEKVRNAIEQTNRYTRTLSVQKKNVTKTVLDKERGKDIFEEQTTKSHFKDAW